MGRLSIGTQLVGVVLLLWVIAGCETQGTPKPLADEPQPPPPADFNKKLEPLNFVKNDDDKRYVWSAGAKDIPPVTADSGKVVIRLETTKFGDGYHVTFTRKKDSWQVPGAITLHPAVPQPGDEESNYDWSETALDKDHRYLVAPDPDGTDPLVIDIMPAKDDPAPGQGSSRELHVVRVVATK